MKTLFTIAATALALAASLSASPAVAQNVPTPATAVSYADLDLRTEAGVRALDRRIRAAVREACGSASSFDSAGKDAVRDCRADAFAQISAQRQSAIAEANRSGGYALAAQR